MPQNEEIGDTPHEARIKTLLKQISFLPGFPDTEEKFIHFAKAYAEFASTEPETRKALNGGQPVIPAAWLIEAIRKTRKFCPMPAEARVLYCKYFTPLDKLVLYEEERD